ncbi:MAG: RidA family protein [Bernardetiaceae bacterium]|nr:RidA family protein [Bernardetiaceae bacterium]
MNQIIRSADAPTPIGPYSQAVLAGNTLYVSGQIAIDAESGELLAGESIEMETHKVMHNIKAVLAAADMNFRHVVKCSIFISDMSLFSHINDVYASYFENEPPARETVEVSKLPKNVRVEISCIAVK